MDWGIVWKVVTWIVGGVVALVLAAWKLSRTWTRREGSVSSPGESQVRIEDTIHGGDGQNGMKSTQDRKDGKIDALFDRVIEVERRLNDSDRRAKPLAGTPRRKSA